MHCLPLTVLVVDDDIGSRQLLEHHLQSIPDIVLLPSAAGVDDALHTILIQVPDILFLDVEMPGKSGFDLLHEIHRLNIFPGIIFQTAFDRYAIEAIKHAAFDYLLKPVDKEELLAALSRYRNQSQTRALNERIGDLLNHLNHRRKIRFNTRGGFIMIDPAEIVYCRADWSYTEIFLRDGNMHVVSVNLGKIEEMLDPGRFFRINRSVLVSTDAIISVNRKNHLCTFAINGKEVAIKIPAGSLRKLNERLGMEER